MAEDTNDDVLLPATGSGADTYTAATDYCTTGHTGHAQVVKLGYSADGVATHISADADGLLVNLGTNNDVTVSGVATEASLSTIAGAVSGSEMQVDIVAALPTGDNDIGNVDVLTMPGTAIEGAALPTDLVVVAGDDGTDTHPLQTDGQGRLKVEAGDVAHDAADAGNPVKLGAKAIAHGANPTAVAAADRTDLYANRAGIPFVIGGHPNSITRGILVTDANGAQTDQTITGTVAAGLKVVVTRVTVTCDDANTGAVACRIGFGTANVPTPTTSGVDGLLVDHRGIPAGGGLTVGDGSGMLGVGADGEELRYTCEDPAGGNLTIQVTYYTIES